MRVAIRVDASVEIGLGHLGRCMALAAALRDHGADILFVTRDLGLDEMTYIQATGIECLRLRAPPFGTAATIADDKPAHAHWARVPWQRDAEEVVRAIDVFRPDWLIVDHYAFDARWHRLVAAHTGARLCVIDDLADRPLLASLLVDHNLAADHRAKYSVTGVDAARILGGPRYALLGPRYAQAAHYEFRERVEGIGIFMGGTDPRCLSEMALRACRDVAGFEGLIEVVTTRSNPALPQLAAACNRYLRTELLVDLSDLTSFFGRHDLQIGAGGSALWERCCIGAPTVAVAFADNQQPIVTALAAAGVVETVLEIEASALGRVVRHLLDEPQARHRLAERARGLVDGRGAERVALAMLAATLVLAPAAQADADLAYRWRNDERTRRYFRDPSAVPRDTHVRWWSQTLAGADRELLIARCNHRPVGFVRLDRSGSAVAKVSFYLDPDLTGLGLGSAALRAAQRWIEARADVSRLVAHVLPENVASAHAFAAAGFARVGNSNWQWERSP